MTAALGFQLEPAMKAKIPGMTGLRVNKLEQGSVVLDTDVLLDADAEGGNVEAVQAALTNITSDGTIGEDPVSAADTVVAVLLCTNSPPEALVNGMRSWNENKALDVMALYTCNPGYTLTAGNGVTRDNATSTCKRVNDGFQFGGLPALTCVADPTTTTVVTTTTTETTTVVTTTEWTRATPAEPHYVPGQHSAFSNSHFLSITIPAVAGMVVALICFLCAIRIDSVLCKVCAEGKV